MRLSVGAGPLPDLLVGDGFYKLGYVTNDRETAIARLHAECGIEGFTRFEPALTVTTPDRTGPASLRCAFSTGRELVVEVMEPVAGAVDVFGDRLDDRPEFQLAFHHIGVLVDDFDAALDTCAARSLYPVWQAEPPNGMRVCYIDVPLLGHFVELVHYGGDSGAFLESVRRPPA
jgi:hypothetical protein